MPRAKRIYVPGGVWHITHRCHNRDFLLKFKRDRIRWKFWLYEAKKRYGLSVLNYIVTSNHIHLLVRDSGTGEIAKSMNLVSGRVGQEYNRRKSRKGAYWEDRYFATAVSTDQHLIRCMIYIDLNMVRAGVVSHPLEWQDSGYHEIQSGRRRYRIIDQDALCQLTGFASLELFRQQLELWISEELADGRLERQPQWSEEVAVGTDSFKQQFCR